MMFYLIDLYNKKIPSLFFFFNDTATTEIYTLSLHDALPIFPGLAAGGSGDVLAGLLGALLARGLSAWDAARLGVHLHGLAGDLGPAQGGLASELAARLPAAWQSLGRE